MSERQTLKDQHMQDSQKILECGKLKSHQALLFFLKTLLDPVDAFWADSTSGHQGGGVWQKEGPSDIWFAVQSSECTQ